MMSLLVEGLQAIYTFGSGERSCGILRDPRPLILSSSLANCLQKVETTEPIALTFPPPALCTGNWVVMIVFSIF